MSRTDRYIEPCLPTLRTISPAGAEWLHEVKFDGFRVQLHKHADDVTIYSKNGAYFTTRFPSIAVAVQAMPIKSVILDGELVATNSKGIPEFHALRFKRAGVEDVYVFAFDILELNGKDLRALPLKKRRQKLTRLFAKFDAPGIYFSETFNDASRLFEVCDKLRLEGVVSKRIDKPYTSGVSRDWIKVKCQSWRDANRERYKLFQ